VGGEGGEWAGGERIRAEARLRKIVGDEIDRASRGADGVNSNRSRMGNSGADGLPESFEIEIAEGGPAHEEIHLRTAMVGSDDLVAIHRTAEYRRLTQPADDRFELRRRYFGIECPLGARKIDCYRDAPAVGSLNRVARARLGNFNLAADPRAPAKTRIEHREFQRVGPRLGEARAHGAAGPRLGEDPPQVKTRAHVRR